MTKSSLPPPGGPTPQTFDPQTLELAASPQAALLVCPTLQGRIFASVGGELVHRFAPEGWPERARQGEFVNLGGNGLWPAPEGGAYAFNYNASGEWYVPLAIGREPAQVSECAADRAILRKEVELTNRRGERIAFTLRREIRLCPEPADLPAGLIGLSYECRDSFELHGQYNAERVLLAPWSLEQFPATADTVIFGLARTPAAALNFDYYPDSDPHADFVERSFCFPLAGRGKFQFGLKAAHDPELIGALDATRGLLIVRQAEPAKGRYFNIADNDQPAGPWSAADRYSIFYSGSLAGFYELETIGAVRIGPTGQLEPQPLVSRTHFLRGDSATLRDLVQARYGVDLG